MTTLLAVEHKIALNKADEIYRWVKPQDAKFRRAVLIIHRDGTLKLFESAFVLRWMNRGFEWYLIFSSQHGFEVYSVDELLKCVQYAGHLSIEELPPEERGL